MSLNLAPLMFWTGVGIIAFLNFGLIGIAITLMVAAIFAT